MHLIFGGTTAGEKSESAPMLRGLKNAGLTKTQWAKSNLKMVAGGKPASYLQAATVAQKVFDLCKGKEMVISGHSKGGGEASFALLSLAKNNPDAKKTGSLPEAYCFSSAELGKPLLDTLGDTKIIEEMKDSITHVRVAGDNVSTASRLFKKLNPVGDVITVPVMTKKNTDSIGSRIKSLFTSSPKNEFKAERAGLMSSHVDYQKHIRAFSEMVTASSA